MTKQKPIVIALAALPNVDYEQIKNSKLFIDERNVPDITGNPTKTLRFSDNTSQYEIFYQENAILRYHFYSENLNKHTLEPLFRFVSMHNIDTRIPANAFVNVGIVYTTNVQSIPNLYAAFVAPAQFCERSSVGLVRGAVSYAFNISNKPYIILLKSNWESTVINVEFILAYNTQSIVTLDSVLPDMLEVLRAEHNNFESRAAFVPDKSGVSV